MPGHLGQQGVINVKGGIIEVVSLARLQQMDAALAARETLPA